LAQDPGFKRCGARRAAEPRVARMVRVAPTDILRSNSGDHFAGLDGAAQFKCACCSGCTTCISLIIFITCMSGYVNLLPDEQMLLKSGNTYTVLNGPATAQLNPFQSRERRQALKLDATQYVHIRDRKTNTRWLEEGPIFRFLGPYESIWKTAEKITLARDDYVRMINQVNGEERIIRGPGFLMENTTDNWARMKFKIEKAVFLNEDTAVVTRSKLTAQLELVTRCDTDSSFFVPEPLVDIVEVRHRTHVKPYEALVVRDIESRTTIVSGSQPLVPVDVQCGGTGPSNASGGVAFFLSPYSRIVRMTWANHSYMPQSAAALTSTVVTMSPRRRRTSRSLIVKKQSFTTRPRNWFVAGDYNPTTKLWLNRGSGANLTNFITKGSVTAKESVAGGITASLMALMGTTSTALNFGPMLNSATWTLCSLTRYSGTNRREILAGTNFFHGHYNGVAGVARYGSNTTQVVLDQIVPDVEWVPICGRSRGSAPGNVWVGNEQVGTNASLGRAFSTLYINGGLYKSDFAIAELIQWNKILTDAEMQEAMDYLLRRLQDAKIYADQEVSSMTSGEQRLVTSIDLRAQRSFFLVEVRTNDNVKLELAGSIFWQITAPGTMVEQTLDPDGDIFSRAKTTLIAAVSNVTFSTFMSTFNQIIKSAFDAQVGDEFYSSRGIRLLSMDLAEYNPVDAKTITSLRKIITEKTRRITLLEQQKSDAEVAQLKLDFDLLLEDNRTTLIESQALNAKLEAETRGSTEGGRKATTVGAYIDRLAELFPDVVERTNMYRAHKERERAVKQIHNMFSGEATLFIKPNATNLSLLLPLNMPGAVPVRRMQDASAAATAAAEERSMHETEL